MAKKKVTVNLEIEESLYESAKGVLEKYDLGFDEGVLLYLNSISNNQAMPISLLNSEKATSDGYFKAVIDGIAAQYEYIYYVNIENNTYREFTTKNAYRVLELNVLGKDFFTDSFTNIDYIIHEEDRQTVRDGLRKENLLKALKQDGKFTMIYRMITTPTPEYYMMLVSFSGTHEKHFLVAVRNINSVMSKMVKYEKDLDKASLEARIDSLTGCYNYLAFQEEKSQLSIRLNKKDYNFALAMCDLNDLKQINDDLGHIVGDSYLMEAARLIKGVFSNSNVYRIGGDEFMVVLTGEDFVNRFELIKTFKEKILQNLIAKKPVVSIGLADILDSNPVLSDVIMRADREMYKNKRQLKEKEEGLN